ncbi:MAG: autotransporter-associated beta strand repeat-containing protein, partial [Terrimicrobiaceae bacterium]
LGSTANTILPAASGLEIRGGTLDLGAKSITLTGSYTTQTPKENPTIVTPVPFLTRPSRVIFGGGTVQNGTITNNTTATDGLTVYEGRSGAISANLAGSAGFLKTTAGSLTLTGNNSFTGNISIAQGTLVFGHANALGSTGTIFFANGLLRYAPGITTDLSARFVNSISAIAIDTNGQTITFANPISTSNGSGLKKVGEGTLILSAPNTYAGGTWIEGGTLQLAANGALPASSDFTFGTGGTLDLNGTAQSIRNLYSMGSAPSGIVNNKSNTQASLTINDTPWNSLDQRSVFNGVIADGAASNATLAVIKTGTSKLTLTGLNTFSGGLTINGGSVSASGDAQLGAPNGRLTLNSTSVSFTGPLITMSRPITVGAAGGTIHVPPGSRLVFNSAVTSVGGGKLTITGGGELILSEANANDPNIILSGMVALTGPGTLAISPADGLSFSRFFGSALPAASQQFTISNIGTTPINWSASNAANWLTLSPSSGTLAAGVNATVTASINSNANPLAIGSYGDTVIFTNTTNNNGNATRSVSLKVNEPGTGYIWAPNGNNGGTGTWDTSTANWNKAV